MNPDEMNKFDDAGKLKDGLEENFPMQDKITTKMNAKGEIQAEVRIGGEMTTIKDIDDIIGLHKIAWRKLREEFPNLVKSKELK